MNWGHKITIAFIFFGVFIISLVTVCVRQDFYLVSPDYYQKELAYEVEMVRTQNTLALPEKPQIALVNDKRSLELIFPNELKDDIKGGKVLFFRPSNARKDFTEAINLDQQGQQQFDVTSMERGFWRIELTWQDGGKEYQLEKKIFL